MSNVQCPKCHAVYANRSVGEVCGKSGCKGNLLPQQVKAAKCPHCGSVYFPDRQIGRVTCAACGKPLFG